MRGKGGLVHYDDRFKALRSKGNRKDGRIRMNPFPTKFLFNWDLLAKNRIGGKTTQGDRVEFVASTHTSLVEFNTSRTRERRNQRNFISQFFLLFFPWPVTFILGCNLLKIVFKTKEENPMRPIFRVCDWMKTSGLYCQRII